jgi:hypothetical protein
MSIRVAESANDLCRLAADPEEADPPAEVPIRSRDTAGERLPPLAGREPPDLVDGLADRPGDALGALDAARSTGFDRLKVDDKDHADLTRQFGPPDSASPVARRADLTTGAQFTNWTVGSCH